MNLKELKAHLADVMAKMEALVATDMTDEQTTEFDNLKADAEATKEKIARIEQFMKDKAEADRVVRSGAPVLDRQVPVSNSIEDFKPTHNKPSIIEVPASAKRHGKLKSFIGPDAELDAYKAGMFLSATFAKNSKAIEFCKNHGINIGATHNEGSNTAGGYLVPAEYEANIIRLVEEYGLARQLFRKTPMSGDTKDRPRRTGGLTSYFVGEGSVITSSTMSWDIVKLVARKLAAIAIVTNELNSDAIISMADEATREIALAFATKEDDCAFAGTGTSTYGGIVGIRTKITNINSTNDTGSNVVAASGHTAWATLDDGDFMKAMGRLPNFAGINPVWVCSKPFYFNVMARLIRAAGGASMVDMQNQPARPQYAGYPVYFTSGSTAMPITTATNQVSCLFGDFGMAAMFGDRAGMTLALSTDATIDGTNVFETDCLAIRGTERFDINVHDVGTSAAAGPVVALMTTA